jgi:hypothetical protein
LLAALSTLAALTGLCLILLAGLLAALSTLLAAATLPGRLGSAVRLGSDSVSWMFPR